MNEKLIAGLVTAAGIAPLCAVCVLGPTAVGAVLAGTLGWLGGAGLPLTVALMFAVGLLVYRGVHRRHRRNVAPVEGQGSEHPIPGKR